ncbi:unnamed protein product [Didymodactylos carnosus]|uniref:Uncharacterized protein n=1 Tax=Didymodactylos carnosus TaxID=1234261 RepID=A0A8S2YD79_9BILA|nr:unnamed protein product [Didymodactylos carnosus]CAF4549765.1 unnamed protein product [Didymodactylos carnosus]
MKYSHIPLINCEIERVMSDAWNSSITRINIPFRQLMSKEDINNYQDAVINLENILEKENFPLPINDNHNGEEIANIICDQF